MPIARKPAASRGSVGRTAGSLVDRLDERLVAMADLVDRLDGQIVKQEEALKKAGTAFLDALKEQGEKHAAALADQARQQSDAMRLLGDSMAANLRTLVEQGRKDLQEVEGRCAPRERVNVVFGILGAVSLSAFGAAVAQLFGLTHK